MEHTRENLKKLSLVEIKLICKEYSLHRTGTKTKLINSILHGIMNYSQNGYKNWKEAWEMRCMHMGMELEAVSNNQKNTEIGVFLGINEEGKMLLETPRELKVISSGECSIKGIY